MDCEKFDQHVIDALYDELDELTHAALKRHVEGCSRCAGVWAGLRATREVGILPIEEPPDDLEDRILAAVSIAQRTVPIHKRVLRGLAWAGSHAMRPQLAMAALFFLVIGSSLLLLRARPGTLGPVRVSELGAPTPDIAAEAPSPRGGAQGAAAATAAPSAAPVQLAEGSGPADPSPPPAYAAPPATAEARAKADEGERAADASGADARAALAEALAVRDAAGCSAAVGKLDAVAVRFAGTQSAADAMWAEAGCYKQMGEQSRAQQLYLALRSTGYRDRAQAELATADNNNLGNAQQQLAGRAAIAPAAAPKLAASAAASANAGDAEAGKREAAGAPAGAKAAKRPAAPAAPNSRARPAPVRTDAAF